ncbi:MAG: DUF6428 family protein [Flavobacteriaceae bacterium]|nr:DUF6428 family protein [Flavobacteriaceae bacterium]
METKEFLSILKQNRNKALLFEYTENKFAGTNYHLTEVKNVAFETVDCGGNTNDWKETHLQIWESPKEIEKEDYMTVDKVIDILDRVDSIRPLWLETEVKVEFGNEDFHTSILSIENTISESDRLIVKLFTNKTGCKAQEECGVLVEETSRVSTEESCCSGSGCC